jgi:hypothetical protein
VNAQSERAIREQPMSDFRQNSSRNACFLLTLVAACLASSAAAANCMVDLSQPLNGTVPCRLTVQPITVCASDGSLCAPFNRTNPAGIGNPDNQDQTTNPIGFVDRHTDPVTGATVITDITRAMLNQFGVDVVYLPIARYDNADFLALNVFQLPTDPPPPSSCVFPGVTTGFTSCDFMTLSQQPEISMGQVRSPPNPSPPVPVGPPGVLNAFFVRDLTPLSQQGSTLYGFSWIGNNGAVIGKNTFFPPGTTTPRFDTLAHEFMHTLGATHFDFGAGGQSNLVSAGCCIPGTNTDLRIVPSSTGILPPSMSPLRTGGALFLLQQGTADQLTLTGQVAPAQQDEAIGNVALDPDLLGSGLLTNVPDSMVMATTTSTGSAVTAAIAGTTSRSTVSWHSRESVTFEVIGPASPDTLTDLVIMLPEGFRFNAPPVETPLRPGDDIDIVDGSHGNLRGICDLDRHPNDVNADRDHFRHTECLLVTFNPPLQAQTVKIMIGIRHLVTISDLVGTGVRLVFGPDTFTNVSRLSGSGPVLTASSLNPDPGSPAGYFNPTMAMGGSLPCTPISALHPTTCPDPRQTLISDNPLNEGGQVHPHRGGR